MTDVKRVLTNLVEVIDCALGHPVLPVGSHTKVDLSDYNLEIKKIYELLYDMYKDDKDGAVHWFREPLNALATGSYDYYTKIPNPMSLRVVLDRCAARKYASEEEVLRDLDLIWKNCEIYNGPNHVAAIDARTCRDKILSRLRVSVDEAVALQEAFGPVDEAILEKIFEVAKTEPGVIDAETGEIELGNVSKLLMKKMFELLNKEQQKRARVEKPT